MFAFLARLGLILSSQRQQTNNGRGYDDPHHRRSDSLITDASRRVSFRRRLRGFSLSLSIQTYAIVSDNNY